MPIILSLTHECLKCINNLIFCYPFKIAVFYFLFQIRPSPDEFVAYLLCHLISEAVFDAN